jgi:pimeloyl-ACP methyl ester carboxylesterase
VAIPSGSRTWQQTRRVLTRASDVAAFAPRTALFALNTQARQRRGPAVDRAPAAPLSAGLLAQVAVDELILGFFRSGGRSLDETMLAEAGVEILEADALFCARGWVDAPATYHGTPPVLDEPIIRRRWLGPTRFELVLAPSLYEPHPGEPGRDRWNALTPNRRLGAIVLRHKTPRPWIVCLHGLRMGRFSEVDLRSFRAHHLYKELGLNVVLPTLPLHGARTPQDPSARMMTHNVVDNIHGVAQAVWDVRRVLSWIRSLSPEPVGLCGVSLGGLVTSLVASLDPELQCAIAAIPLVDLAAITERHIPRAQRKRAERHHLIGEEARRIYRVISPLTMTPTVPRDRRFVIGGLGDRMVTPQQAYDLWVHWDEPEAAWYPGSHVFFQSAVNRFIEEALHTSGLATGPRTPTPAAALPA